MILGSGNYYDISILGLSWLSQYDPDPGYPRSISAMLYTLVEIGLIDEAGRRRAMNDRLLRQNLIKTTCVAEDKPGWCREQLRDEFIVKSPRRIVAMVYDGRPFEGRRILRRGGYRVLLTNAGHRYAVEKAAPYAGIITEQQFVMGYRSMRDRVSQLMRARGGRRSEASFMDLEYGVDIDDE